MSRPDNKNLHGAEIRRLLHATPEPVLSVEQRTRLRARLGLEAPKQNALGRTPDQTQPGLALLETADDVTSSKQAPSPGHRTRDLVIRAAALCLILGSALTLASAIWGGDSVQIESQDPGETASGADAGAAAFCRNQASTLDDAVTTWDGVENWSYLTDRRLPAPDLIDIAVESLSTLQDLQPMPEAETALAELKSLRADGRVGPSIDPPYEWSSAERAAQADAVNNATETIDVIITRFGWEQLDGCE